MDILKQSYVKYGLIMTGLLIGCLALMEITGQNESFENKSPIFFVYQFLAPAVVWYFAIKAKKKELKGKLTFKQGITQGFKISLVFAVISPFIFALYYTLINPAILTYVKSAYGLNQVSDVMIIIIEMFAQFVGAIIFGTVYAAIISFFLKTKAEA